MKRSLIFSDPQTELQLQSVAAKLGDAAYQIAAQLLNRCEQMPIAAKQVYERPMQVAKTLVDDYLVTDPRRDPAQVYGAVVAAAGLRLPDTLAMHQLPASVQSLLPAAVQRLACSLLEASGDRYDESADLCRKDLRFVVGQAVPCGAQDVDLYSAAPWTTLLKNPSMDKFGRYLLAGGTGVWFRIHTDPRNTGDFDEAGWRRCYKRIADLLVTRPEIRGMVGTSWFYDPQLLSISPRLAYLQVDPIQGGAFMLRNGPGAIHTQRATQTSPSRRKLYEDGKYVPVCWSVLWPRKDLLAWAAAQPVAGT